MCEPAQLWLSVVVPVFNEQKLLEESLHSIEHAISSCGLDAARWEMIVSDNASTDASTLIASQCGARVVHEAHRQISRARNRGARAATGTWLLFVDADTRPDPVLMRETLWAMRHDSVCGGGATVASTGASTWVKAIIGLWNQISKRLHLAAGGYLFCRNRAFVDLGGFSNDLYAGEELDFSRRLKQWGRSHRQRFCILRNVSFQTSLRKAELYKTSELLGLLLGALLRPRHLLRDKNRLGLWYDGRR